MPKTKGAVSLIGPELAKAKTLAATGYSYRRIGRELGKSDHTIKRALTASPEVVAEVKAEKLALADLYEELNRKVLEAVTEKDIAGASLLQKATASGIFTDKMRLLRDQPTSILNVQALLAVADAIRDQERAESEAQFQKAHGLPAPAPQTCQ